MPADFSQIFPFPVRRLIVFALYRGSAAASDGSRCGRPE